MDLVEAAASGSQIDGLRALRDYLAESLANPAKNDAAKAALGRLLAETFAQIATLERLVPAEKGSTVDEVALARAERSAKVRARA